MPITSPPPAQPPVVIEQPSQPQPPVLIPYPVGTPQNPSTSAADLRAESQSNNDSRSASDSSSVNSASQSNVQINNNSNRVEVDGIKIPTTTLNLNGYYNNGSYDSNDWGVVVGISTSLDGKKRANDMLDRRIKITQLQYERELAGACASIDKDGYVVNPDSPVATELAKCNTVIRARKKVQQVAHVPAPRPVVNTEIQQLRAENAELRSQLALILQKLDQNATVNNGGF